MAAYVRGGLNTYSQSVTGGTGYPGDAATGHGTRLFVKWVDALERSNTPFMSSLDKLKSINNPKPEWAVKARLPHRVTLGAALDNTATVITLAAGHGTRLQQGQILYIPADDANNPVEICWVSTEPSGDSVAVVRGYAGTTAVAHLDGLVIEILAPALPELSDHPLAPIVFGNLFYNRKQRVAMKIEVDLAEDVTPNLEYPGANIFESRLKEKAVDAKQQLEKTMILGQRTAGDPNPSAKRPSTLSGLRHFAILSGNTYDLADELLSPNDIEEVFYDHWVNVDENGGKNVLCSMNTARILDTGLNPSRLATVKDDEVNLMVRKWHFRTGTVEVTVNPYIPDGEMYIYNPKYLGYAPYEGLDWHFARKKAGVDTDGDYVQGSISGDFTFFAFAPSTMAVISGWNTDRSAYPMDLAG